MSTHAPDPAGRLFVAVARINRMLRREAPAGLGHGAVTALATIARDGPLRLGDLAVREGLAAPSMTRIVASLEADGYVSRATDPVDGRAWLIQATPKGEQLIGGAKSARAQLLRDRMAGLPPAYRQAIESALPALEALSAEEAPADRARPGDGRRRAGGKGSPAHPRGAIVGNHANTSTGT